MSFTLPDLPYSAGDLYVLYTGGIEPRKNIDRLLEAYGRALYYQRERERAFSVYRKLVDLLDAEWGADAAAAVTVDAVIRNLTEAPARVGAAVVEPGPSDVVFEGTLDEVNRFFYENDWSDGLPIVPPTPDRVARFLRFCDRPAQTELGVLLPDKRRATVWNVAVNGVMAGCRAEYMPILVALVEAMADPRYGVEHSGNTPGAETLIILNGPLIKELGFNYEQGALRDGVQANTTIGRFWRLYLRNVAGFLHHRTDKGTFGNTWRVVLAENEDAQRRIGWTTIAADEGVPGGNAVTISRYTGGGVIASVFGDAPERIRAQEAVHIDAHQSAGKALGGKIREALRQRIDSSSGSLRRCCR